MTLLRRLTQEQPRPTLRWLPALISCGLNLFETFRPDVDGLVVACIDKGGVLPQPFVTCKTFSATVVHAPSFAQRFSVVKLLVG
jgi:hypothetical protein